MKIKLIFYLFFCLPSMIHAQQKKRVLFLGNSYTAVNDLPGMLASMANSMGDTLVYGRNTPGGYTLQDHFANGLTRNKIREGNWDYLILQEQSQRPSLWDAEVNGFVFPNARKLDSMFDAHNPCGQTLFFMTWGRRSGDASFCPSWPPVCTYQGMDSMLNLRYRQMADQNQAEISPVGAVWNYIRNQYPTINLYNGDGSHPALAGTYAAACCFYTALFRKDPTTIIFNPGLDSTSASAIRAAVKAVLFNNFTEWHIGAYNPWAQFIATPYISNRLKCYNLSRNASRYHWDFGDGTTDSTFNPEHTYSLSGNYQVTLTVSDSCKTSSYTTLVNTIDSLPSVVINEEGQLYPNPAQEIVYMQINQADEVYLVNMLGQRIHVYYERSASLLKIHLTNIAKGTYIVVIRQKDKKTYRKLVKS